MTREEAIEQLKKVYPKCFKKVDYRLLGGFDDHSSPLGQAIDMAIKALEQEPMLDKIRAEIDSAEIPKNQMSFFRDGINCALQIIDKYKAESEEV